MTRLPKLLLVIAGLFLAWNTSHAQTFPYKVEQLGALPGEADAIPFGINSRGDVVGGSGYYRAFLFTDGAGMVELFGPNGRPAATARRINDAGIIVGESWGGGMPHHAVRWSGGVSEDLGAINGTSRAWNINNDGVIVGDTPVDALDTGAFVLTAEDGSSLIAPARMTSHAYDVSDAGVVTGAMTVGNYYHAYRFTPGGEIQDLGATEAYPHSFGKAINVSGQVAGTLTSASGNAERVFRYTEGVGIVVLGGVGETNDVWGMNARGDIVGRGLPVSGVMRVAFIYTDAGGLQDLNLLIDPALNLRMLYAHDINDAGQIVGLATDITGGGWRAIRLTPTVAPTSIGDRTPAIPVRVFPIAPNPTGQSARFQYELMQASAVRVDVYDVAGRLVRSLVDSSQEPNLYSVMWDGRNQAGSDVPSGLYFFRIQAGTFRDNVKLVIVR
ncbi:MAG TPA: FlgD immunoglobulin-like domain containing protein [Candidatus Krumholzibacteria bacterium]|nr:FlgD immunoglobulin-like domain containing protein [Candidatus Krumholzibacteria bacterium]